MAFNEEKVQALSKKLSAFGSSLGAEEQALLAAMIRLGGQAIPKNRPVRITHLVNSDLSEAFQQALQPGSGSTLVGGRLNPVTVDIPPVDISVGPISAPIDVPPVTVDVSVGRNPD